MRLHLAVGDIPRGGVEADLPVDCAAETLYK
jgi:hypothetical protein